MTFSVEIADAAEIDKAAHRVEIYIDRGHLESLMDRLSMLSRGDTDHSHFFSHSWGEGDLTEEAHSTGNILTHHLKIILVE